MYNIKMFAMKMGFSNFSDIWKYSPPKLLTLIHQLILLMFLLANRHLNCDWEAYLWCSPLLPLCVGPIKNKSILK